MEQNQVTGNLLRSALPAGWTIADRSGAGGFGARSITAVVWSHTAKASSPLIISIYIADTDAPMEARNWCRYGYRTSIISYPSRHFPLADLTELVAPEIQVSRRR